MQVDPEEHLRELSRRLLSLVRTRPASLLASSTQLLAVANAFVVLDLLAEERGEDLLADHRRAVESLGIELHGVKTGELTLVPASGHGSAEARRRSFDELDEVPLAVGARSSDASALEGLRFDWFVLTPSGLRGRRWVTGHEAVSGSPSSPIEVQAIDDLGRPYHLVIRSHGARTHGADELSTAPAVPPDIHWLEIAQPTAASIRIDFKATTLLRTGMAEPAWPTPAECFLSWLTPELESIEPDAQFGLGLNAKEATEVVASVADALLAVGALPAESPLLRQLPHPRGSRWRAELSRRWRLRIGDGVLQPTIERIAVPLGTALPFERSAVVVEGLGMWGDAVYLRLYVAPDLRGEYWPVATRTFDVRAIDDVGATHEAIPATHWNSGGAEGRGDLFLWPPIGSGVRRLRLEVTTLWESGWTDIDLPGR